MGGGASLRVHRASEDKFEAGEEVWAEYPRNGTWFRAFASTVPVPLQVASGSSDVMGLIGAPCFRDSRGPSLSLFGDYWGVWWGLVGPIDRMGGVGVLGGLLIMGHSK